MFVLTPRILLLAAILWSPSLQAQNYEYKIRYGMVVAGSAELRQNLEDGILRSELTMSSSPWLSNLWTLADSIQSEYDLRSRRMITHVKAIHEGSYHRRYVVDFLDSSRVQVNTKVKDVDWENMLDIPSLIYVLSTTKFHEGDTLSYKLWDGRGFGTIDLLVRRNDGKRSLIKPFGSDDVWKLIPLSSTRKSRENGIQISVQLSRGLPHVPEEIEIDTKYGAIQMRLND
jgi:hypothetical protein